LSINNEGSRVSKVKFIPTIGQLDFASGAMIKSQYLLLRPKILHHIITYNILPKKRYYDEVTFMDIYLIDYMIRGYCINLSYIMMNHVIMAHNKKQKSLPYGQCLTTVIEYFDILLTNMERNLYSKAMEIDNRTLNKMGYVLTTGNAWVPKDQVGAHAKEEHDEENK
jgi:hypothetical protein